MNNIHAEGGFEIRNFLFNDPTIAVRVGDESLETEKNIGVDNHERIETVLGMQWMPSSDIFTFIVSATISCTFWRSSIFQRNDRMGLISFFFINGRTIMQDIWDSGIRCDDPITDKIWMQWKEWIGLIPKLNALRSCKLRTQAQYILGWKHPKVLESALLHQNQK